jgi:hypothetical protein
MQIARANRFYKRKELEYFVPSTKSFGNVDNLSRVVEKVSRGIFNPITDAAFRRLSGEA